ncbi:MAG: DUF3817 domain-containing protein [Thermocrispum sp.]
MTPSGNPSTPETADVPAPEPAGAAQPELKGALLRFRIAAVLTGIGLLVLVVVMVIRIGYDNAAPSQVWSPIHGALYLGYVALAVDLGIRARWSVKGILLVLLAGCVPFVSFAAERIVTHRVLDGRPL